MRRSSYYLKIPMLFLLVSLTLCGCAKEPPVADSSTSGTEPSQNASTQAEPVTLEQALLKERGKPYAAFRSAGQQCDKNHTSVQPEICAFCDLRGG